ncbi:MAG: NACHT domain-containing protein [Anaerolineae bacterium]
MGTTSGRDQANQEKPLVIGTALGPVIGDHVQVEQHFYSATAGVDMAAVEARYRQQVVKKYGWMAFRAVREAEVSLADLGLEEVFVRLGSRPVNTSRRDGDARIREERAAWERAGKQYGGLLARARATLGRGDQRDPWAQSRRTHAWDGGRDRETERTPVAWDEVLRRDAVIIGASGSGKSTLLRWLTVTLAQADAERLEQIGVKADENWLPILVELGETQWARMKPEAMRAINWVDELPKYVGERQGLVVEAESLLSEALVAKRCVVMCDGLDEVDDGMVRATIIRSLGEFKRLTGNRVLIGTRPGGVADSEGAAEDEQFGIYEVEPLTAQEMQRFLQSWYGRDKKLAEDEQRAAAERLSQTVAQDERLREAVTTPLMGAILLRIDREQPERGLPKQREEIYERSCQTLVEDWERGIHPQTQHRERLARHGNWEQHLRLLAPLAFEMHQARQVEAEGKDLVEPLAKALVDEGLVERDKGTAEREAKEFLRLLGLRSGLLQAQGGNRYRFAHLSFQEFLAARYIAEQEAPRHLDLFMEHLNDDWWKDVHWLAIDRLGKVRQGERKLIELVEALLAVSEAPRPAMLRSFSLRAVPPTMPIIWRSVVGYQQGTAILGQSLFDGLLYGRRFERVVRTPREAAGLSIALSIIGLLLLVIPALVQDGSGLSVVVPEPILLAAQVVDWITGAALKSLVVILSVALVLWLLTALTLHAWRLIASARSNSSRRIRWVLANELELASHAGEWLGEGQEARKAREQVFKRAMDVLKELVYDPARFDETTELLNLVCGICHKNSPEQVRSFLWKAISHSNPGVRERAATMLVRVAEDRGELRHRLMAVVQRETPWQWPDGAWAALLELAKIDGLQNEIEDVLVKAFDSDNIRMRERASYVGDQVVALVGPKAETALLRALTDRSWVVRRNSAVAFGRMAQADTEIQTALRQRLMDEDIRVVDEATWALNMIRVNSGNVSNRLPDVISDENNSRLSEDMVTFTGGTKVSGNAEWRYWELQGSAAMYGAIGAKEPKVADRLISALDDDNSRIRLFGVLSLREISAADERIKRGLSALIADGEPDVRAAATGSLIRLGLASREVVQMHISTMHDLGFMALADAAESLGSARGFENLATPMLLELARYTAWMRKFTWRYVCLATRATLGYRLNWLKAFYRSGAGKHQAVQEQKFRAGQLRQRAIMGANELIGDGDGWSVRRRALMALSELAVDDPLVVNTLLRATKVTDLDVRLAAVAGLGRVQPRSEWELLELLVTLNRCLTLQPDKLRRVALKAVNDLTRGRPLPGYRWAPTGERQARRRRQRKAVGWALVGSTFVGLGLIATWASRSLGAESFVVQFAAMLLSLAAFGGAVAEMTGWRLRSSGDREP